MLFFEKVKQEVREKLTGLCLSVEMALSESIQQLQGNQELAMKPIRISKNDRLSRSLRR
jgi:hypothetical protein